MLLLIGNYDLTPMILKDKYSVNQTNEYEEWKDGNGKKHRVIYKKRIVGTIELLPQSNKEYENLIDAISKSETGSGSHIIRVFVNNLNKDEAIECYLTLDMDMSLSNSRKWWRRVRLEIEER